MEITCLHYRFPFVIVFHVQLRNVQWIITCMCIFHTDLLDFWDKYRDTFLETCGENLFDKEKQYFAKQLERDDLIDLKDPDGTAMKAAIEERVLKEPKFILKLIRFMKRSFELYPIGVGSSYTLEDPTTDGSKNLY